MAGVHNVFHMFHLRKYVHDPDATIPQTELKNLVIEPDLNFVR